MKKILKFLPLTLSTLPIILTGCTTNDTTSSLTDITKATFEGNLVSGGYKFDSLLAVEKAYCAQVQNNLKLVKNDYLYQMRQKYDEEYKKYDSLTWKYNLSDFTMTIDDNNNCYISCNYTIYKKQKINDQTMEYKLVNKIANQPIAFGYKYISTLDKYDFNFYFDSSANIDWNIVSQISGNGYSQYKDQTFTFNKNNIPLDPTNELYKIFHDAILEFDTIYYLYNCSL